MIHIVQGGAVSHMESPEQSVPLFLYLLCLCKHVFKHSSQIYQHHKRTLGLNYVYV